LLEWPRLARRTGGQVTEEKHIELNDWGELEDDLRQRLKDRNFTRMIMFRNFDVGRLKLVLSSGTDRTKDSPVWRADDFDYDHTAQPAGKSPDEIVYVHRVNPHTTPFTVLNLGEEHTAAQEDLTEQLGSCDGVSIYDSVCLERVAHNEHWFIRSPLEALLFVYSLRGDEDQE
jgi:hypothetical protein